MKKEEEEEGKGATPRGSSAPLSDAAPPLEHPQTGASALAALLPPATAASTGPRSAGAGAGASEAEVEVEVPGEHLAPLSLSLSGVGGVEGGEEAGRRLGRGRGDAARGGEGPDRAPPPRYAHARAAASEEGGEAGGEAGGGGDKPLPPYLVAKRARARDKAAAEAAERARREEEEERGKEREREERERKEGVGGGAGGLRSRFGGRGRGRDKGKGKGKEGEGEGEKAARDELLLASSTSSSPGAQPPKEGPSLASYHATEQATLLTALTALSSTLKSSTLEFSSLLARDREVLSSAEAKLAASEGRMGAEGRRLEGVRRKGRGTTCATVGVLVGVAVLWVLVFLLIKVT